MWKSAHFRVGQCFSPYPVRYRRAFAFSTFLYPQCPKCPLRCTRRLRQRYGLTLFPMNLRAGRTLPLRRWGSVHDGPVFKDHASPRTILVQACQHVWLAKVHGIFSEVHLCWSYPLLPSSSPPSCWQIPLCLAAGRTGCPVATLSPALHTELLPAPHGWVGNG